MPKQLGLPYKQHPPAGGFDAIVIGSGIGGLSAAAFLAKHGGKRVLVLERHYTPGGYTHVFRRSDYEWDVGVHYVGQVQDAGSDPRRIFDDITDGKLSWAPMPEVYDRIIIGDRAFDLVAGADRFRETLQGYFPREARTIERYLGAVRACTRACRLFLAAIPTVSERVRLEK
jgi:all-trans-retinol 13,14-reductase